MSIKSLLFQAAKAISSCTWEHSIQLIQVEVLYLVSTLAGNHFLSYTKCWTIFGNEFTFHYHLNYTLNLRHVQVNVTNVRFIYVL